MKFSVCIPTYNRPRMIKKAIDSILSQSFSDFEIVICDNSENTDTENVLQSYSDKRIRYFRHEKNIGIAGNWNALLNKSRGEYVKFLNDDDEFLPICMDEISKHLFELESKIKQHVGVITCAAEYVNERGDFLRRDRPGTQLGFSNCYVRAQDMPFLWCYNAVPLRTPTHMAYHRKSALALGGFDIALDYTRDVHLALQLASRFGALILDSCPLARFTLHSGQDAKGITIETRISDLIVTKEWAIKEAAIRGKTIDRKAVLAEVCLREMALMLKNRRASDAKYAFSRWVSYKALKSLLMFVDNNIYRISNFQKKYLRVPL